MLQLHTNSTDDQTSHANSRDPNSLVNVDELINRYTVEELCQSAENYYQACAQNTQVLAKPFGLTHVRHLLPEFAFILAGLDLYPYMTVLDFGCGTGWMSRMLNQMSLEVISMDVSPTALQLGERLKTLHPVLGEQPPHRFLHFDGRKIDLPDQSVDRILCLDAFHHVPNQEDVLSEMSRVLRQGGIAGFSEPGPHHSKSPQAQTEMRLHCVIENDIVLEDIQRKAMAAGFTEMRVAIGNIFPLVVPHAEFLRFQQGGAVARTYLDITRDRSHNYPQFFLHKGDQPVADSRSAPHLVASIRVLAPPPFRANHGEQIHTGVEVVNKSSKTWLPSGDKIGAVNLGGALFEAQSGRKISDHRWHVSSEKTAPGEKVETAITLDGLPRGSYTLQIDLVSEHVCWFAWNGSKPAILEITVL